MKKYKPYIINILFDALLYSLIAMGQTTINFTKWEQVALDTFAAYILFGIVFTMIYNSKI